MKDRSLEFRAKENSAPGPILGGFMLILMICASLFAAIFGVMLALPRVNVLLPQAKEWLKKKWQRFRKLKIWSDLRPAVETLCE